MMRVLLLSVYEPSTFESLYPAQSYFIAATTKHYRHIVVSAQKPPADCEWLAVSASTPRGPKYDYQRHIDGLRVASKFIRHNWSDYDLIVVCDSDAFPVRRDWAETLVKLLRKLRRGFAAPLRTETFVVFPHISFVAFLPEHRGDVLPHFRLEYRRTLQGFMGLDTAAKLPLERCLPLLRSNVWSPSPMLHTIYGDIVYHRGYASRARLSANPRGMQSWNYWRLLSPSLHHSEYNRQPLTPAWINRLLGEHRFEDTPG